MNHVDNSLRHDDCPFCGSSQIAMVGLIHYRAPVLFSSGSIALDKEPELWKCGQCHSGFVQNVIPVVVMTQLYTNSRSSERWANSPFEKLKTPEVVDALKELLPENGAVVDVGANTGEFLDFARGFGCQTIGVELSAESRRMLEEKGHVPILSLEELADHSTELITAFDLVEHLHDVNAFFRLCEKKLRAGGKLAVLTGDIGCLSARYSGAKWWYCSYPEHISFPSRAFLTSGTNLRLVNAHMTWASNGYRVGWPRAVLGWLARVLFNRYRGLPALGADHCLYVFEKKKIMENRVDSPV